MLENYTNQSDAHLAKTPEEEIAYLRAQIAEKELHIQNLGERVARPEVASAVVHQYAAAEAASVLAKVHPYHSETDAGIKLPLSPERDDEMMAELLGVMMESGVKKALAVLAGLQNPHLEDDFH